MAGAISAGDASAVKALSAELVTKENAASYYFPDEP